VLGALGDIHGDFASVRRIMSRHSSVRVWISVGDVADDQGRYEPFDAPLYWIKGNNENFDAIAAGQLPESHHFLENARPVEIEDLRVVGLGGTFAPTWYETPAAELPHPVKGSERATALADKRRHFVKEEVDRCRTIDRVDLFLSHEAARPYRVRGGKGPDAGKTPINDVLAAMTPRLHLFGHHHEFTEQERQGVRSVGLDLVSRSHLLIDTATLEYTLVKG